MTEAEWLGGRDPAAVHPYLTNLPGQARRKATRRKHRLYACACCRASWEALADPRSRAAVEVAELLADDRASSADAQTAQEAAYEAYRALTTYWGSEDFRN